MVVSYETAKRIYESMYRIGLTDTQITGMLELLSEIPGNQSYRDTVTRIVAIHQQKRGKK